MTITTPARRLGAGAALGALCALTFAASSPAQASISDFFSQETLSLTQTGIVPCYPDLSGSLTGTATIAGQIVENTQSFHVDGTEMEDYRIDFADGRYLVSSSPTHFEFNTNLRGRTDYTATQQDPGTLYAADGSVIGPLTVLTITHIAWNDANEDGIPDPGEITANVSQFRVSCP